MAQCYFVAGTDTEVGKTYTTAALLASAAARGLRTAAVKPVASGCEETADGLRNSDALLLQEAMTLDLPYQQVNPFALAPAIAPHIAAREAGRRLDLGRMAGVCRGVMSAGADLVLIEGAGGWRTPLGPGAFLSQLPRELNIPVILVVGMRLGCINHALLSAEAIRRDGLALAGWVANFVGRDMARAEENLATLRSLVPAPLLGTLPFDTAADYRRAAVHLDLAPLLG
ncbi:dethiobiotin synthase [Microbulbifer thermotolerans]|uniref:ATP-dependent dethiobiotin synthetase BioD n=1 Tax=Microbulbifer thermotolerans TaxID=252514 RepID=A0A143HRA2_MICTH|nr:dethiobiotin synthase [Microbulbifer thermotolerans]AMX03997.1 dethiobiotin synthase [Microbulbifer thermotolerans]MCX2781968.1 dethiobiotin synthase [Microbulbifer thermotolerans]MCX2783274.1 dethiobiotin synthase [Microbulbifer thermotolerans]